jgi:hypothetical protein
MRMGKREYSNMGIVTFPISEAEIIPLSNLIDILYLPYLPQPLSPPSSNHGDGRKVYSDV